MAPDIALYEYAVAGYRSARNLLKRYTAAWVAAVHRRSNQRHYHRPQQCGYHHENFLLQLLDPADNENVLMEMSARRQRWF